MFDFIKRKYEASQILKARDILMERNVSRANVTSRRDNNDMWYMGEKLGAIAKRISNGYGGELK